MERCSTSTIFTPSTYKDSYPSGHIATFRLISFHQPLTGRRQPRSLLPPPTSRGDRKLQMPTPTRSAPSQYKAGPATAPLTNCRRLQRPDHSASNPQKRPLSKRHFSRPLPSVLPPILLSPQYLRRSPPSLLIFHLSSLLMFPQISSLTLLIFLPPN